MKATQRFALSALLVSVGWTGVAAAQGAPSVGTAPVVAAPPAAVQTPPQPVGPVYQVQPGQTVYVQPPANGQPGAPIYVQPAQPVQPAVPYAQPGDPNQQMYMQPGQQPVYVAPPPPVQPMPRQVLRYDLKPNYGLIIGGAVTLGVSWLIHSGTAAIAEAVYTATEHPVRTMWTNYIPVLGPWITMTTLPNDSVRGLSMAGLAFSGLVQGTGLALLIAGAASRQRVPVYAWNQRIQLTPSIGPSGTGLALSGNF
ncbi:MAG: hypothetical protein JNJ46_30595 [Myxococcales bacterium]|nr:hypothetical protein [Myxococcales bacterium]